MSMKHCLLLLGAFLALALPARAADPAYITAAGQGTVSAPPDTVTVNAGVTTTARTAREALTQNSQAMTGVFAALRALNIPDRNVRTTNLNLQPQYGPPGPGGAVALAERPITAYRAINNVSVTIEDVSRAGTVLDALITAGANQSGGISYSPIQSATASACWTRPAPKRSRMRQPAPRSMPPPRAFRWARCMASAIPSLPPC
jgi:uncharacterized protein YggE